MASTTNDYRLTAVENERKEALTENDKLYGDMANESEKYYQAQIDASKEWEAEQKKNQQAQTDFAIEKIEQQKDQTTKDYTKEQSGAYVDWQKESNRYGVNAEEMASSGMLNTGYGESSQVRMYNTYQNRIATARETYNLAILNYDNAIKDAQLQNNSLLAEIAYKALQQQLELSLQGFQYKNQLLTEGANKKLEINKAYDAKYQAVLDQINEENRLAEEIRQFNETQARLREQMALEAALEREQMAMEKAIEDARLAEEQRQFDLAYEASQKASSGSSTKTVTGGANASIGKATSNKSSSTSSNKSSSTSSNKSTSTAAKTAVAGAVAGLSLLGNTGLAASYPIASSIAGLVSGASNNKTSSSSSTSQSGRTHSGGSARTSSSGAVPNMTSYSQAAAYMRSQGVATGDGGLMTKSEWTARKNAGSNSAETSYSSYNSYLNNFVQYRLENPQK